jgi:photosystem II stability/assembly factor-like uncharacterized protein
MIDVKPGSRWKWNRSAFALFLFLASCLFETKYVDPDRPGYVSLELNLRPNTNALFKTASADTVFRLDSLIVILSASGQTTTTYAYAISGRSDSANITVAAKIFPLAALRTWKAKILTLDTTLNPSRKDTIHLDSISFTVNPGDTAVVSKTVNPVFSILRTRLVSNAPGSITNNVKWVRLRVDGTTRDSSRVGSAFRSVNFGNGTTGYAVGDSGNLIRSTDAGVTWTAYASGATRNLRGVTCTATNTCFAVGDGGTAIKTTSGTSWSAMTSNTTQDLNAAYFSGASNGWAVGNAGAIIKSTNGTSYAAQTSGTTQNLNGVHFTSANNGNAVGNAGTILRTANGGTAWSAQTSGTTQNLNAVFFPASATGYAVGNAGVILKTTNSGSTWTALTSGTTADLNSVYFISSTEGYAAGDGGVLLRTTNGSSWTAQTTGNTQNLYGIAWTTNSGDVAAVGDLGAQVTSTNGTSWTLSWFGAKSFDVQLTYKYFKPSISHALLLDAIDVESGTLRGYQAAKTVLLAPGKDSTLTPTSSMAQCGYGSPAPACSP